MQARYYDPVAGRFLSTDPIGYRDQFNLYAYVHNDPVNKTDPTGEFGWPGFLLGFATDFGLQLAEGKSPLEVDLISAGASGFLGATGLGAVKQLGNLNKAIRANRVAGKAAAKAARHGRSRLARGKDASHAARAASKATAQYNKELYKTVGAAAALGGAAGGKLVADEVAPEFTINDIVDGINDMTGQNTSGNKCCGSVEFPLNPDYGNVVVYEDTLERVE